MRVPTTPPRIGYRHEALFYSGPAEFRTGVLPFIRAGIAGGEPTLVLVSGEKTTLLRAELGPEADWVSFADVDSIGQNPARIIAAWRTFARRNPGVNLRGVGEPITVHQSADELAECQLHEALLNIAFDDGTPLWLLCPYDLAALSADVIDNAHRTHPHTLHGTEHTRSSRYLAPDPAEVLNRELPAAPVDALRFIFNAACLGTIRELVNAQAHLAGLTGDRVGDLIVAVNELATNTVEHAGGSGTLRIWTDDQCLICEIADGGTIHEPLAGRVPPSLTGGGGRGLWIANQLCDLLQIQSSTAGSAIRVRMHL
ncbi:MAG TPA: anti-sigma factor RsbA family regulatory protein [Jatrophihabitantaceae bacterium]|jgi:anti-sigma regulatory factor (Ser/Thr protein kinase)|nr:anti-sigma factor RsbA family regulatory protein [Jatrophihabitantaceae bacterium]